MFANSQIDSFLSKKSVLRKSFVCTQLTCQTVLFEPSIRYYHSGLELTCEQWPSRGTLFFLRAPLNRASPSNGLLSYRRQTVGKSYLSAEMQSVYSTAPVNWTGIYLYTVLWCMMDRVILFVVNSVKSGLFYIIWLFAWLYCILQFGNLCYV